MGLRRRATGKRKCYSWEIGNALPTQKMHNFLIYVVMTIIYRDSLRPKIKVNSSSKNLHLFHPSAFGTTNLMYNFRFSILGFFLLLLFFFFFFDNSGLKVVSVQFSSVAHSSPTLCDPMNRSTPGLPAHHQLLEFTQTHIHQVGDAIQPSHPLSLPSPPAPNPSQHQSLFQ